MNPFSPAMRYPNRSSPSPFSKKTTPQKEVILNPEEAKRNFVNPEE